MKAETGERAPGPRQHERESLIGLLSANRYDEAEAGARRAMQDWPDHELGWKVLVVVLGAQRRFDEALPILQRILQLLPADLETRQNLGNTLQALGRYSEAESCYRRLLELAPGNFGAHNGLGNALRAQGRFADAEISYRHAFQADPASHEALNNIGVALSDLGRLDEAEARFRGALELNSEFCEAYSNLGSILRKLGRNGEAEAAFRRGLAIRPKDPVACNNLGNVFLDSGRLAEAAGCFRSAMELDPGYYQAHSNLLFCLSHDRSVSARELFAEHRRFGERFGEPLRPEWPQHANSRDPERALRIGFVSGDFRDHAVANCIAPVLEQLAHYPQLSLQAYSNHASEDHVTQRLKGYVAGWHHIAGLSDAALAEKIRKDGIDILVDLSGHTAYHRLLSFARRPAPVQASWIGYPGSTGLSAVDYYLADRFFLPHGDFKDQFTEKIVYLPAIVPFLASQTAPAVSALPALKNGFVTFGSFNRPNKLSPEVIALWSGLMLALPDARMVLGGMPPGDETSRALSGQFAKAGIGPARLRFHERCESQAYLGLHHQVDICLDTFPYCGGTTTLNALWMGVPTLTLAGSTPAGRGGAAPLGHVGLDMFVAADAADFLRKGLHWAGKLSALAELRADLRGRFARSAMGQPAMVAAGVERALRIMWQRWCAHLPAESFEVR